MASICTNPQFLYKLGALIFGAGLIGGIIILILYLYSKYVKDDQIYAWSRLESYQLAVSVFVAFVMILITSQIICPVGYFTDLSKLLGAENTGGLSIYAASENYLIDSANNAFDVFLAGRYIYAIYTVASRFSVYMCAGTFTTVGTGTSPGMNFFSCIMGASMGGGAGAAVYVSPFGGHGYLLSITSVMMNTALMEYFTSILYLFLLEFANSGIAFFLLPLGVLVRMIPFSRRVGAMLMSIAFVFMFVYPLVLSIFYIRSLCKFTNRMLKLQIEEFFF